jgi:hypothetical protein
MTDKRCSCSHIERQRYECAIHEAGHTVTAYALGLHVAKKGAVLRERDDGYFDGATWVGHPDIKRMDLHEQAIFFRKSIVLDIAGPIAERKVDGDIFIIPNDVINIAWALGGLRLDLKQVYADNFWLSDDWRNLYCVVIAQIVGGTRERAVKTLEEDYARWKAELNGCEPRVDPAIFDILWPLAQKARRIVNLHWSSIQMLAADLLKARRLSRNAIEARLPWARKNKSKIGARH